MSGLTKKAKQRASRLFDRLLPSSRMQSPVHPDPAPDPPQPPNRHTYADPQAPPSAFAVTGSVIHELLEAARDGSDLCLPLKAMLVSAVKIWDVCERTKQVQQEYNRLNDKLAHLLAITAAYGKRNHLDARLKQRLDEIVDVFERLVVCVDAKLQRGLPTRTLQSKSDISEVKDILVKISARIEVFLLETALRTEIGLDEILSRLPTIEERRWAMDLAALGKINKTIESSLGGQLVHEAAHDTQPKYAGCMPGTRNNVLHKLHHWVSSDPLPIFWLAGMAGMGKTSIAVTLCRMLQDDPDILLGGSFFCSRTTGSIARTDVRRVLPSIAALLAGKSVEFASALAAELKADPRVAHKPVSDQIGPLILKPLSALSLCARPIVFVIDALDELDDERELGELLRAIADVKCGLKVKFILTSRPEIHIRGTPISDPEHNTILHLHTISEKEVASDIRIYIDGTLKGASMKATWYTEDDIDLLVKLSGGLFIFASTVIMYLLDPDDDDERGDRLRKATSAVGSQRTAAMSSLDKIYELVLTEASRSDRVDDDELTRMRQILACVLAARASLSVEALSTLIEVKPGRLRASLRRLHSLVYMPPSDEELGVRTLHASFGDYLLDRAPQHIRLDATLGHDTLARGCLRRLGNDDLCFNVSRSRSSFEPNSETEPDCIALSLIYACLHWAHHVDVASNRSSFDGNIGRIFRAKFLFWLEVLSVTGKIGLASGLLRIAISAVEMPVVSQFLRDANAFIASSHEAIGRSAPHIYISAVPFAAKGSQIYHEFMHLCTGVISVTTIGIDRHDSRLLTTLTGHEDRVNSVAYSPCGSLLASGSADGTTRIWETRTGAEAMPPLCGGDGGVNSVSFAPNSQRVASGTVGGTIHIWSVLTGRATLPPLRGHSRKISSVTFSSDGTLIASASADHTVRLWNAVTGNEVSVIRGHADEVKEVIFSPDSRLLASASADMTVRLWKPLTGEAAGDPLTTIDDIVMCLAFSPDGQYLAAGSRNTFDVQVWNLETRMPIPAAVRNQSTVMSLAFSRDGLSLVLAGRKGIRFWDWRNRRELSDVPLASHTDWIKSISLSPDGLYLASGSDDRTIRIWDAATSSESQIQTLLQAHNAGVSSLAVSSDGKLIVSGSYDHSIRVWDTETGDLKSQPLLAHTNAVLTVAISSDSRFIASALQDHIVRLWDIQTGEPVGNPLRGHESGVNSVAFSPDVHWLASGSDDGTVRVWNIAAGKTEIFSTLHCMTEVSVVAFSPDGRLIAAGDYSGCVHFWRAGTNQLARPSLQAHANGICCIAFSPDATRIVVGAYGLHICVWDVYGGHEIFVFEGHVDWVRSVAYSPDNRYIASASDDKTIRVWDAQTGAAVVALFGHAEGVQAVTFMPDGRSIVSGALDKTIHVWDVDAARLLSSQVKRDPLAHLASARLDDDGWLVGSSGELLLWLPVEYRGCIQLPPCSMLIGPRRIFIDTDNPEGILHWGDQWRACWRDTAHPATRSSP